MNAKACIFLSLLSVACQDTVAVGDDTTGDATGSSTNGSSSGEVAGSTTSESDTSSSSSGSSGESGDEPTPLPTSRLVIDVETPGGHALMLRELVDGVPEPAMALTGDVPASARITTTPLGTSDRIAIDIELDDETHDLFLVDWTSGHPAVVTQFDDALTSNASIGPMAWVEEVGAIVVRIAYSYYRIDMTEDGPSEPMDLLEDIPFFPALDESQTEFVVEGPLLVVRAGEDLWVADIADPDSPAIRLTDFEGTTQHVFAHDELASGHLVYNVATLPGVVPEEPSEIHVTLRVDDGWSAPLEITPPVEFPAGAGFGLVRPGTDEFIYGVVGESAMQLRHGGIDGDALAPPIVLRDGATSGHAFSPDGMQLAYRVDADQSLELITFTDEGPSRPRMLDAPALSPPQLVRPRMISADGFVYFNVCEDSLSNVKAILRVGLEAGAASQVLAGELAAQERIREDVFAPDERWLAFARTGIRGLTTSIVDLSGAEPGTPVQAARGDAPILEELIASPDSNWLAATRSHGGAPDSVVVVRRDDPAEVVLEDVGLAAAAVWLP